MTNALLLSNGRAPGGKYFEHALDTIADVLGGRTRMLFVPYASGDGDRHLQTLQDALGVLGVRLEGIHRATDPLRAIAEAESVFVSGGNSFRLLKRMRDLGALGPLADRARAGMPYFGASAGSNLACPSIRTTNDMPIVNPGSFEALGLIPFQLNPHYPYIETPDEMHAGEGRDQRLAEFLDENDVPVVALPEGTWLRVSGESASVGGVTAATLFQRGADPRKLAPGCDVSTLLTYPARFDTPQ